MAAVLKFTSPSAKPFHANKKRYGREEAQARAAYSSTTVYVGNLAFVTTDTQILSLFGRCGSVERVIMGLNKNTRMPCGFAFVIFLERASVVAAVSNLNGTVLDERVIKVEVDKGFYEGRQFGRGTTGGQVRDEIREGFDEGRGGYSVAEQAAAIAAVSGSGAGGPMGASRRYSIVGGGGGPTDDRSPAGRVSGRGRGRGGYSSNSGGGVDGRYGSSSGGYNNSGGGSGGYGGEGSGGGYNRGNIRRFSSGGTGAYFAEGGGSGGNKRRRSDAYDRDGPRRRPGGGYDEEGDGGDRYGASSATAQGSGGAPATSGAGEGGEEAREEARARRRAADSDPSGQEGPAPGDGGEPEREAPAARAPRIDEFGREVRDERASFEDRRGGPGAEEGDDAGVGGKRRRFA